MSRSTAAFIFAFGMLLALGLATPLIVELQETFVLVFAVTMPAGAAISALVLDRWWRRDGQSAVVATVLALPLALVIGWYLMMIFGLLFVREQPFPIALMQALATPPAVAFLTLQVIVTETPISLVPLIVALAIIAFGIRRQARSI